MRSLAFFFIVSLGTKFFVQGSDIGFVVILDSTEGIGDSSFVTEKTLLASLLNGLPTGSSSLRISVINAGEQVRVVSNFTSVSEGISKLRSAEFLATTTADLTKALYEAQSLIREEPKLTQSVVLLFTAYSLDCGINAGDDQKSCRVIAQLVQQNTTMVIVSPKFHETVWPIVKLAPQVIALRTNTSLYSDFTRTIQKATGLPVRAPLSAQTLEQFHPESVSNAKKVDEMETPLLCSNNPKKLWIDLVILLDSTTGIGENSFHTLKTETASMIRHLTVGQTAETTRVAFLNVGERAHVISDLRSYNTTEEARHAVLKIPFLNDDSLNVKEGLKAARKLFEQSGSETRQKMAVLWTSQRLRCPTINEVSPCRAAVALKSSGVTLVTIDAYFYDTSSGTQSTLAPSPCDRLSSQDSDLAQRVLDRASVVNCFCGHHDWFLFETGCKAFQQCLHQTELPLSFANASDNCERFGGRLVSAHTGQKNGFYCERPACNAESRDCLKPF